MCNRSYVDFVFVRQKTAYDMRISDWSSDVCSSDLVFQGTRQVILGSIAKNRTVGTGIRKLGPAIFRPVGFVINLQRPNALRIAILIIHISLLKQVPVNIALGLPAAGSETVLHQ